MENWESNRSFSEKLPRYQIYLDSTSLGAFKQCPRYYYYYIVCGYTKIGVQINLDFGSAAHKVGENYQRLKMSGVPHDTALEATVVKALAGTWDYKANAPAFDDPQKNRVSLVRFAVEYLDHYERDASITTVQLANGKPAVELTFAFDSRIKSSQGEPIILVGHLDRLGQFNDTIYIVDLKTTYEALGSRYAERFTPDNQFTLYTLAGRVALGVPAAGVLLDAAQIGTNFVRFQRYLVYRPQPVLDEWLRGLPYWTSLMEACATAAATRAPTPEDAYPQNDKACSLYGGCQYRGVCGRSPLARKRVLDIDFQIRRWDPFGEPR
jgi:hypothetical protein